MRAFICILSATALCLFGCRRDPRDVSSIPLSFYVVSEEKIDAGRFIDTADFPKLGYIAASPDLSITRLEAVMPDMSRRQDVMVDTNGKASAMPLQVRPALNIRMRADDARKLTAITKKAVGRQVLLMLGDTPLIAPKVVDPISPQSLILTLSDETDKKKIEDELKKLVR